MKETELAFVFLMEVISEFQPLASKNDFLAGNIIFSCHLQLA